MTSELGLRHTRLVCSRAKGDPPPPIAIQGLLNLDAIEAKVAQAANYLEQIMALRSESLKRLHGFTDAEAGISLQIFQIYLANPGEPVDLR